MPTPAPQPAGPQIEPAPSDWRRWFAAPFTLSPTQRRFREQLNLPTDRPLIMTGHQAQFWHPGILAKLLALHAAARAFNTATAWLVPDQDTTDPWLARYPARDAQGHLTAAEWKLPPAGATASAADLAHTATASLKPAAPPPLAADLKPATTSTGTGLAAMRDALARHTNEPTYARQATAAAMDLAADLAAPPPLLVASALSKTDLFRALVDRMRADPARCLDTYNNAVSQTAGADLRPLIREPARLELPLWRLEPNRPRRPVFAADLPSTPIDQLAPRALLLTGLMRLAPCDLFIHGTGGIIYDRASTLWLTAWLGDQAGFADQAGLADQAQHLAPSATVTATLLLPLGVEPVTPDQVARARWRIHHAAHTPADLGDEPAQRRKLELVGAIAQAPRRSHARADLFRSLHDLLTQSRAARTDRFTHLRAQSEDLLARAREGALAADRTWPFPLYPGPALLNLKREIDTAFGL